MTKKFFIIEIEEGDNTRWHLETSAALLVKDTAELLAEFYTTGPIPRVTVRAAEQISGSANEFFAK